MTSARVAVLGAAGFIGSHLLAALRRTDPDAVGTIRQPVPGRPDLVRLDLAAPDIGPLRLEQQGYRAAVVAAAVSRIDACEGDPAVARAVNVTGTLALIRQLQDKNILPVFLSSDYVFDGRGTDGYADDAPTSPGTEYGRHKAEVEAALARDRRPALVIRLSKVFGLRRRDGTLLDEMAQRLTSGESVRAAEDQVFCPTLVDDVIDGIRAAVRLGVTGVVHVCSPEPWSRYDLAVALADALDRPREQVDRIALDDLPGVRRPRCTRLIPSRFLHEVGWHATPIRDCIEQTAKGYRHE